MFIVSLSEIIAISLKFLLLLVTIRNASTELIKLDHNQPPRFRAPHSPTYDHIYIPGEISSSDFINENDRNDR